jgi:hypothetical protein
MECVPQSNDSRYPDSSLSREPLYQFLVGCAFSTLWTQCNKPYKLLACHMQKTSTKLLLRCTECILHRWDDWNANRDPPSLWRQQLSWITKQSDSVAPPYGITQHSHKSSRVLISGCRFFIFHLRGALVRDISMWWYCFAVFAFSSRYWNTSSWAFDSQNLDVVSLQFDFQYACVRYIITSSGSSEHTFKRFPSWGIWSAKWFRRCVFTKLKPDSSTRCHAVSD